MLALDRAAHAPGQSFDEFKNVGRWFETIRARPAVQRGFAVGEASRTTAPDAQAAAVLFGQTAASTARATGN